MAALLALTLASLAAAQGVSCADCDGDGDTDIVDALRAAQIDVGAYLASPTERIRCDVDSSSSVTVLDALRIARVSSGHAAVLVCPSGLSSGQPPAVAGMTVVGGLLGGGAASGAVEIELVLADPESDPVDIVLEVRTPGRSYAPATIVGSGAPWQSLATTPGGVPHVLTWDSAVDLPDAVGFVSLRATPYDPGVGSPGEIEVVLNNAAGQGLDSRWVQPAVGSQGAICSVQGTCAGLSSTEHRADLLLDGTVLITGGASQSTPGLARVLVYDPTHHEIRQVADLPGGGRSGHITAVLDRPGPHEGWLLCGGGWNGVAFLSDLQLYDPVSQTWQVLPASLEATSGADLFTGLVAGGKGEPSPCAYVASNDTLTTGPLALGVVRASPPGIQYLQTNVAFRVELDPNGDDDYADLRVTPLFLSFVRELDEGFTVTHHRGLDGVAGTLDDRLVVFGGAGVEYDTMVGDFRYPTTAPSGFDPVPSGCVLADAEVIDLATGSAEIVASTHLYDTYGYIDQAIVVGAPGGGNWDHPSLIQRYNHDAVVLQDGGILIVGGINAWADVWDAMLGAERPVSPGYDLDVDLGIRHPLSSRSFVLRPDPMMPGAGWAWQVQYGAYPLDTLIDPVSQTHSGLINFAEASLVPWGRTAGGTVLLAGGDDLHTSGGEATASFQIYDPVAHAWGHVPDLGMGWRAMIQPRALHSLTGLPGGAVLAFGGSPGAGVATPVASYELYLP